MTLGELGAMQPMDPLEGYSTGFRWLDRLARMIVATPVAVAIPTVVMALVVFGMTGMVVSGAVPGLTPTMLALFKITFAVWAVLQGWYLVWGFRVAHRSTGYLQTGKAKEDFGDRSDVAVMTDQTQPSEISSERQDGPTLGSDIYR